MTPQQKALELYKKFKMNKNFVNICILEIKKTNLTAEHLRYWESVRIEVLTL